MDRGAKDGDRHVSDTDLSEASGRSVGLSPVGFEARSVARLPAGLVRPIVVVLGMHRSGTSLLSNVLHVLGVDMADSTDHVSPKNPGGFWERPELVAVHDEILAAIERPIALPSHVLPFPPAWWRAKAVQALKPNLIAYVQGELAKSSSPWGFKDPRTCRLLPLWTEVFRELSLEPVYVVALRTPTESATSMANKSAIRRLSVANSELMWLSYNYDIARHVMAKRPVITVDYDEWFTDAAAVAGRLAEALGIGDDLSADDIAETMATLVRPEYRHEFEGQKGIETGVPLAHMLYRAMSGANGFGGNELRTLRSQIRLVDLFFKSAAPVALDLDAAAAERSRFENEREAFVARQADATQALAQSEERAAQLEQQTASLREQLAGSEALAEQARTSWEAERSELEKQAETLREQVAGAQAQADQLSAAQQDEAARHEEQIAGLRDRLAEITDQAAQSSQQWEAEKKRLTQELQAARQEVEAHAAEAEMARRDAEAQVAAATRRQRQRSRALLLSAKRWRDTYRAEHGEPTARLEAATEIAALRHELDVVKRQFAAAEERSSRFAAQIEARDRAIADLSEHAAIGSPAAPSVEGVFAWPSQDLAASDLDGRIDVADELGISGSLVLTEQPHIVPAVELRVDGVLVVAQSCLAGPAASGGRWPFFIPWAQVRNEFAGREGMIIVAGIERELGRVTIPRHLGDHHLSPAQRAADLLGGTVAEAAEYHRWLLNYELPEETKFAREYRDDRTATWPAINAIIYGGDQAARSFTLRALRAQAYANWEAICVDGSDDDEALDPRVRSVAAKDIDTVVADHPADALFTFAEAGDSLSVTALLHLGQAALDNPDFTLIYSDEDRFDARSGLRAMPYMKGAWSPDLGYAQDYVSRLALVRRNAIQSAVPITAAEVYRATVEAALSGNRVIHLPFVLYHRALANLQSAPDLTEVVQSVLDSSLISAGAKAIREPDQRLRIAWPVPKPAPRVSLIVPTRDRVDLLRVSIDGFLHETRYPNLDIVIVDNESEEKETKVYLDKVSTHPRVRVIRFPGPFNFSKINNAGAAEARGDLIGLMNNDLKVLDPDWLPEMVSHAVRPDVGMVGAKLLYGNNTIQHAGVTLGISLASHLYKKAPGEAEGRQGRLVTAQDVSAVTAACLLMRRDVWDEVGGLDEEFPVAYNDVDLCLKVRGAGYRIVWTPDALVYHLESQSRGKDVAPEKRERLAKDKARLAERWGDLLGADPFHSPNLSASHADCRLAFPPRAAAPWQAPAAMGA